MDGSISWAFQELHVVEWHNHGKSALVQVMSDAIWHQATTSAMFDPDLCHHMEALGVIRWIYFRRYRIVFTFCIISPGQEFKSTHAVETLPCGRQGPIYSARSIYWLLMTWQCKEPGHQGQWYPPSFLLCWLSTNVLVFCRFINNIVP